MALDMDFNEFILNRLRCSVKKVLLCGQPFREFDFDAGLSYHHQSVERGFKMKKWIFPFVLVSVMVWMAASSHAQMVLQLNLEQLTALSERVFVGKCISVKDMQDEGGRLVQEVTFNVDETLKGPASEQVTFRQLASASSVPQVVSRPGTMTIQGLFQSLPTYVVGEETVVFLSAESRLGLTAPVGLLQGKFNVESKADSKVVVNGSGNRGLFINWDKSPKLKSMSFSDQRQKLFKSKTGPVPYADFVTIVKSLAQ